MKKFRTLFYRPAIDGKWIDNGIATWTKLFNLAAPNCLTCSHEEIWTPDDDGKFSNGMCWTSTMGQIRSKDTIGDGTRVAPAVDILRHPERWFYCEFCVTDFGLKEMIALMQIEVDSNKGYDTAMILNFFLPLGIGAKDKWICSEFSNHHAKIALKYSACYENNYKVVKKITDTMSPLRTANFFHGCGVSMYNMDNTVLLAGK